MMETERLVKMANDISNFFSAEPDRAVAVQGTFDHIRKFWEPRMRQDIIHYRQSGSAGLSEIAGLAVDQLSREAGVQAQG
jgi:formate dehydrogenase subunit delta